MRELREQLYTALQEKYPHLDVWVYEKKTASIRHNEQVYIGAASKCSLLVLLQVQEESEAVYQELEAALRSHVPVLVFVRLEPGTSPNIGRILQLLSQHNQRNKYREWLPQEDICALVSAAIEDTFTVAIDTLKQVSLAQRLFNNGQDPRQILKELLLAVGLEAPHMTERTIDADVKQLFNLGLKLQREGRFSEACDIYARITEQHGPYREVLSNYSSALSAIGRFEEAAQIFEGAKYLEELTPHEAYNYSFALLALEQYERALKILSNVRERGVHSVGTTLLLGATLVQMERSKEAICIFQEVLSKSPTNVRAMLGLGYALQNLEDFAGAYEWYAKARNLGVKDLFLTRNMALCAHIKSQDEQALTLFRELQNAEPDDYFALIGLAHTFHALGNSAEAELFVVKTLQLYPGDAHALVIFGLVKEQQKDYDGAEESYRKAIRSDPTNSLANLCLGVLCGRRHDYSTALRLFRKYLTPDPEYAFVYSLYGVAASKLRLSEEALEAHHQALRFEPTNPQFRFNLACAFSVLGDQVRAACELKSAIDGNREYLDHANTDEDLQGLRESREWHKFRST